MRDSDRPEGLAAWLQVKRLGAFLRGEQMKRFAVAVLFLAGMSLKAQIAALPIQHCIQGGTQATVSGLKSTNYQQGIIPSCTVTIYLTGTTTLATYYLTPNGSPQTGPFTASSTGQLLAYAAQGIGYDVYLSGGIPPNTYNPPITITDIFAGGGGGGGGGVLEIIPGQNIKCSPNGSGSCSGNVTINSTAGVDACSYPGSDLGTRIIAAYTANPASALIIARPCVNWTTPFPAFPNGDGLYLQAGFYNVPGGNKLLGNNHIYGDGNGVTTLLLQNNDTSGEIWQTADGSTFASSNITIDSMTLDGNRANQTVTTFGTGVITVGALGSYTSASSSNIRIAARIQNCKVNCIAGIAAQNAPFISNIDMTGSHINGAGEYGVLLQGVNNPTWIGVDVTAWGLDVAARDAIFSTAQFNTSNVCPSPAIGGHFIGGTLTNTVGTKFGIEMTALNPGCYQTGAVIQGITSYGNPLGTGGNGISVDVDHSVIDGNVLTPPFGVSQTGVGEMEITASNSVVSNNTIHGGSIWLANAANGHVSSNVQLTGNHISPGVNPSPSGIIIGGGGTGTTSNITVTGGDINVSGWTGASCYGILLGLYAGNNLAVSNIKIDGVTIHQDSGIALTITSSYLSGNTVYMNGSFPTLAAGTQITFSGFSGAGTFLNGKGILVSSTTGTTFQGSYTHADVAATGAGAATGIFGTCHGVYSAASDGSSTLQIRNSTFTNLLGGFGDQPEPSVGITDIDYQNNILRGTPIYDNTPPVSSVVIRQYGNTTYSTDTGQNLNGNAIMDQTGQLAAPGGVASGSLTVFPQINNPIVGQYDGNQACSGGGSLTSWADQSGNGNTLTAQGTAGTCVTNALNGLAAVSIPSGGNNGFFASGIAFPQQFPNWVGYNTTLVVVYKKTVSSTGYIADLGTNSSGSTQTGYLQYSTATNLLTANNGQTSPSNTSATVADDGGWHIAIVTNQWDTTLTPTQYGTQTLYFDGAQVGQTTTLSVPTFANGIDIGGSQSTSDNSAAAEYAYANIYGGAANAAQVKSIETYFSHKFALPQTGVWYIDASGNATVNAVTTPILTDTGTAGGGTQCAQVNNAGVLSGTGSGCGNGGTISGQLNGVIPLATGPKAIEAQSPFTVANSTVTSSEALASTVSVDAPTIGDSSKFYCGSFPGTYASATQTAACLTAANTYVGASCVSADVYLPSGVVNINTAYAPTAQTCAGQGNIQPTVNMHGGSRGSILTYTGTALTSTAIWTYPDSALCTGVACGPSSPIWENITINANSLADICMQTGDIAYGHFNDPGCENVSPSTYAAWYWGDPAYNDLTLGHGWTVGNEITGTNIVNPAIEPQTASITCTTSCSVNVATFTGVAATGTGSFATYTLTPTPGVGSLMPVTITSCSNSAFNTSGTVLVNSVTSTTLIAASSGTGSTTGCQVVVSLAGRYKSNSVTLYGYGTGITPSGTCSSTLPTPTMTASAGGYYYVSGFTGGSLSGCQNPFYPQVHNAASTYGIEFTNASDNREIFTQVTGGFVTGIRALHSNKHIANHVIGALTAVEEDAKGYWTLLDVDNTLHMGIYAPSADYATFLNPTDINPTSLNGYTFFYGLNTGSPILNGQNCTGTGWPASAYYDIVSTASIVDGTGVAPGGWNLSQNRNCLTSTTLEPEHLVQPSVVPIMLSDCNTANLPTNASFSCPSVDSLNSHSNNTNGITSGYHCSLSFTYNSSNYSGVAVCQSPGGSVIIYTSYSQALGSESFSTPVTFAASSNTFSNSVKAPYYLSTSPAQLTSATTIASASFVTTGLVMPSIAVSTTVHGHCYITWEQTTGTATVSFGAGMNNAPTDLFITSNINNAATGGSNVAYNVQTATAATIIGAAATPGASATPYFADFNFVLQVGASNAVTLTFYGLTSNTSDALVIEPGSYCSWLP